MMYSGKQISLLEIGCGHGHVAACLKESLPHEIKVTGMDISKTAVEKARLLYPENSFLVGDIKNTDQVFERYEVVIFSQILWYVIDCFPKVFENIGRLLKPNGCVVFVNAFIRDQQYGKEVVDGFDGLIRYVLDNYYDLYNVINAEIELSGKYLHDDGCMIIRKKN